MKPHTRTNLNELYLPGRIIHTFRTFNNYPATWIEAPFGYGKTIALQAYFSQEGIHPLWVSVQNDSSSIFWNDFSEAFSMISQTLSLKLKSMGFPNDSAERHEAIEQIQSFMPATTVYLIIDDYHLIQSKAMDAFFSAMSQYGIDSLKLILTSRKGHFTGLKEHLLKGYFQHLEKDVFQFTYRDVQAYYKMKNIRIDQTEAKRLQELTGGWISALYLLSVNYSLDHEQNNLNSIYNLLDETIYASLTKSEKNLLIYISQFTNIHTEMTQFLTDSENAAKQLNQLVKKNAFIDYNPQTSQYQIHNLFRIMLQKKVASLKPESLQRLNDKAGQWYQERGDYLNAMRYFLIGKNYEALMNAISVDKTTSIAAEHKDFIIQCFEECPDNIQMRFPIALLSYGLTLMSFNEMERFEQVCNKLSCIIESQTDSTEAKMLLGELELLLSFTQYNDISKMAPHLIAADAYINGPSKFLDPKGYWTFGAPSVLYKFYIRSGELDKTEKDMEAALPYYYRLSNHHGAGADLLMKAECLYMKGDFENAEICCHRGHFQAKQHGQQDLVLCSLFLQVKLELIKGSLNRADSLLEQINTMIVTNDLYTLKPTADLCIGFVNAHLNRLNAVPSYFTNDDLDTEQLLFPTMTFANMVYARTLLSKGCYLKLIGLTDVFMETAGVLPNLLGTVYFHIYHSAAYEKIFRREKAIESLKLALDIALPDQLYMPFVENSDFIAPLLREIHQQKPYTAPLAPILSLLAQIEAVGSEKREPNHKWKRIAHLTDREREIAQLASLGFSNQEIAEKLLISQNTVKDTLKKVFAKLDIKHRFMLNPYFHES